MQHSQRLPLYQIDAFTNELFKGNPAAVVPLESWLPNEMMQSIAAENNLPETAFFVQETDGFGLRWFTPTIEVRFCGHATLATAHTLYEHLDYQHPEIRFFTKSGILVVKKRGQYYEMDFPADQIEACLPIPLVTESLGNVKILEWYKGQDDYMVILESQEVIEQLKPDFAMLSKLSSRGIIATAKGDESDFVSRCFFPQSGIDEDPVTGSAHTTLTPYWAAKFGKNELTAKQVSARGGYLHCTLNGTRVTVRGEGITYLIGEIII